MEKKKKKEFWEKYTFPDVQLCFSLYFPHAHSRNLYECLPGSAVSCLPNPSLPPISKPMHPKCVHLHAEEHLSQTICTVRPQRSACLFASPPFFYREHSGVHLKGLLWPKVLPCGEKMQFHLQAGVWTRNVKANQFPCTLRPHAHFY